MKRGGRTPPFHTLPRVADLPLTLVDVGVRWGFPQRWLELAPPARLIGFEADPDECKVLAERHPGAEFVALALGEAPGRAELHVAHETGSSSLFAPDESLHAVRPALAGTATVRTETVELDTLAAWAAREGVERVDALKLDVQGAELAVLRGAGALLDGVRGLEVEVEFHPIYRGQPLFGTARDRAYALARSVAFTVLATSIATVMRPTPPGTGLTAPAFAFTAS